MKKLLPDLKILFIPCAENDFRPRFLKSKFLLYYIAGTVVLNILVVAFWVSLSKTVFFADVTQNALFNLTNRERESVGLAPLKESTKLNEAAYQKAKDMLDNDYFAHSSPSGITPWYWFKSVGYRYRAAGENLAVGFIDSKEVVDAWINSPSHRDNLFNPNFKESGIAVLTGNFNGQETTLVVQNFGSPAEAASPIAKPVSSEIKTEEPEKPALADSSQKIDKTDAKVAAAAQFIATDYFNIARKILFYSVILIAFALVLNIFIHFKIQDRALILRSIVFLALLAALMILMEKEIILQVVPHNFQIQ